MINYYIYESNNFHPATEDELFSGTTEYSFLATIETTISDLDPMNENVHIETDYIASNEVDVTNMSEVLDVAQMFRVDENHERYSQTLKVELTQ
jgi:hypothetical protein